jgi:hypothetical protein
MSRRGHRNGSLVRLGELADAVGASLHGLDALRRVAHAWPRELARAVRVHDSHARYRDGGPAQAARRRDVLLGLPRSRLAGFLRAGTAPKNAKGPMESGLKQYRHGDSNPGFRRERAAS